MEFLGFYGEEGEELRGCLGDNTQYRFRKVSYFLMDMRNRRGGVSDISKWPATLGESAYWRHLSVLHKEKKNDKI